MRATVPAADERRDHPHRDRRAVLVTLSRAGEEMFDTLRAEYRVLMDEEMASLDDHYVETLGRAIEILDRLIARLEERGG